MTFTEQLAAAWQNNDSLLCVGLDPDPAKFPAHLKGRDDAIFEFCKTIVDATADLVCSFKPQIAYFAARRAEDQLEALIAHIHEKHPGIPVILDAKRGDIGSTAQAYAEAFLGGSETGGRFIPAFGADSVTVNGYLGSDGVKPFADLCKKYDKGIFVLVKTSNPSSCEVQDLVADGGPLYERMGELCADWGGAAQGYSDIGAVIGATWPEQLGLLRRKLAHTFFLVPGYGAQGGGADDAAPAFDGAGGGAVVNSSRAIIYAYKKEGCREEDFAGAARREALRMKDALNAAIAKKSM